MAGFEVATHGRFWVATEGLWTAPEMMAQQFVYCACERYSLKVNLS